MDNAIRMPLEIRAAEPIDAEAGVYRWRLFSAAANRVGDESDPRGFTARSELPLLYNHNWNIPTLGTWTDFESDADEMTATVRFDLEDDFARQLNGKVQRGVMKDVSIGFLPTEQEALYPDDDEWNDWLGYFGPVRVKSAVLMEASLVTVPADETAVRLQSMRARREQRALELTMRGAMRDALNGRETIGDITRAAMRRALGGNSDG